MLRKIEVKYDFECVKEVNNFVPRHFFIFRMDSELKFCKLSRLEFDRI
jgi:hypothetical protein